MNAVWLPNAIVEASVLDEACSVCGPGLVHLIRFKFQQGEIPPQYGTEYTGCVGGCDAILKDLIEICGTGGVRSANRTNTAGQNTVRQGERRNSRGQMSNMHPQTDVVKCHCQETCSLLTAQTESNRGRRFYKCPNNNCNFFSWETQEETDRNNESTRGGRETGGNIANRRRANGNPRNAGNAGRNSRQGRDGGGRGNNDRGRRSNAEGRGSFVRATGETGSNGACFLCGETSHWASNCPNRHS